MTLLQNDFEEKISDVSPSIASFNLMNGRATMPLYVRVNRTTVQGAEGDLNPDSEVLPYDLINAPYIILGGISTDPFGGRIFRGLPLAHPQFPWLYASSIQSVRGIGGPPVTITSVTPLEAVPLDYFALYSVYEFVVEFTSRNYAVLDNDSIEYGAFKNSWIDVNGQAAPQEDQYYATEWSRFTEYQVVPQNDWVTCNIGGDFVFLTNDTVPAPPAKPPAPDLAPWPAMPRVLLPNEVIKMTWHYVPFRYYSSPYSYLRRFRGKINQFDWYDWDAGELLYMSCNPIRYTPPLLQPVNWLYGSQTVEKWATMELYFLATKRDGVRLPYGGTISSDNGNYVIGGHNLLPWHGDRQFYYVNSLSAPNAPNFFSFPFELLFTDPDYNWSDLFDDEGGGAEDEIIQALDVNPNA